MAQISGEGDVQRLNAALDSEHAAVAAYTTAATMLDAQVLQMAQSFLAHEQEHAAKLAELVRDLGETRISRSRRRSMHAPLHPWRAVRTFFAWRYGSSETRWAAISRTARA
jgi:rubrerythrin